MDPIAHVVLAAAAAVTAASLPQSRLVRLASALAMIPVALADAPTWSFIAAGGSLFVALARPGKATELSPLERIQRHLEWCRRRDETAHLLWVHAPQIDRETATAALDAFRVTDAAALLHEADGREEIVAMVDNNRFEREGLERRLRARVGESAGFGWSSFPDDGVTLDTLFRNARVAAVASTTERKPTPSTQLHPSFRRWGTRLPSRAPARSSNQG